LLDYDIARRQSLPVQTTHVRDKGIGIHDGWQSPHCWPLCCIEEAILCRHYSAAECSDEIPNL
jgi:hypothetical protein